MANKQSVSTQTNDHDPSKRELQQQMQRTRESLAETIGEIKQTVEQEIATAKQTVSGVLDYREQFKEEPLVWSLGTLSAGFALGYTLGYAHKNSKRGKHSQLAAFADSVVDELSTVGNSLVMPALNLKIRELFGFDFAEVLAEIGASKQVKNKTVSRRRAVGKVPALDRGRLARASSQTKDAGKTPAIRPTTRSKSSSPRRTNRRKSS